MKIIHCICDDKFIDATIDNFNSIEGIANEYYYVNSFLKKKKKLTWVKNEQVKIVSSSWFEKHCKQPVFGDVIILHSLYSLPFHITKKINSSIRVVWFAWGFDIYSNKWPARPLIDFQNKYKKETLSYLKHARTNMKERIHSCLRFTYFFLSPTISYSIFKEAVHRIDYFSGVLPIEYDLCKKNDFFRAKKIIFNYTVDDPRAFSSDAIDKEIEQRGKNILVGNSASPLTCHLDILEALKEIDTEDRKIVVPLSYSGPEEYKEVVCRKGYSLYKENFLPLKDFLPYWEYENVLKSCGISIFYYEQQAAMGNILVGLWNGTKVFLSETSIGYKYLRSLGILLFSIQSDLKSPNAFLPLTKEEIISNRIIIAKYFSHEAVIENLSNSLEIIKKDILHR